MKNLDNERLKGLVVNFGKIAKNTSVEVFRTAKEAGNQLAGEFGKLGKDEKFSSFEERVRKLKNTEQTGDKLGYLVKKFASDILENSKLVEKSSSLYELSLELEELAEPFTPIVVGVFGSSKDREVRIDFLVPLYDRPIEVEFLGEKLSWLEFNEKVALEFNSEDEFWTLISPKEADRYVDILEGDFSEYLSKIERSKKQ